MARRKGEFRYDGRGELRQMAEAEGYVMCRRKGASAFVMSRKDWDKLAKTAEEGKKPTAPQWNGGARMVME